MSGELIWAAARVMVSLPLVLLLIYLVLKYGLARRYTAAPGGQRLKLIEQLPLGPKTVLSLVTLGDRCFLLAHQDNSVFLIKELDELPLRQGITPGDIMELTPRTIKEIDQLRKSGATGGTGSFARRLQKLAGYTASIKGIFPAKAAPPDKSRPSGISRADGRNE